MLAVTFFWAEVFRVAPASTRMGMRTTGNNCTMSSTTPPDPSPLPELQRARRAIVVVDVVESVRLMQAHEADVIERWRRFVNEVRTEVLPLHGGRLVKSLGDGMLLEFASVPPAVAAALEMQRRIGAYNDRCAPDAALLLRVGVHSADVVSDDIDVFGTGVNLAARLASLAQPEQIVVSAEVRDFLIPGYDADLEDLGECFVKHLAEPIRAWRLLDAPAAQPAMPRVPPPPASAMQCAIAVLPFAARRAATGNAPDDGVVLADDVIGALVKNPVWRVVSRLSAAAVAQRGLTVAELGRQLGVRWIATGTTRVHAERIEARVELADAQTDLLVATDSWVEGWADFDSGESTLGRRIAEWIGHHVVEQEAALVAERPLATVQAHALLLSATSWMHRMARPDIDRATAALDHLLERHPRSPDPRVWRAKAHLIAIAQGWSPAPERAADRARDLLARALDMQPRHALALALEGHIGAYARGELDAAEHLFERALQINSNEALTWLFLSNLRANRGEGAAAVLAANNALALSPLDPLRFIFDIFAAYAALVAGDAAHAMLLARRSVRANRLHFPSHPVLICAEVAAGQIEQARASARTYLALRPQSSVSAFVGAHRGTPQIVSLLSAQLREAGMPI